MGLSCVWGGGVGGGVWERYVGSTKQSLEYLEHRVCTENSGAGMESCVRIGSCFLTKRSGIGVERREVLNGV